MAYFHCTFAVLSTTHTKPSRKCSSNVTTVLWTPCTEYWVWSWIKKSIAREISS